MAYIFDPLRNTFIDDEDTSLGNKLAFLDEDLEKAIREIGEKYGPNTIKTLNQLPENKPAEVEDTEAFNRFNRMYEMVAWLEKILQIILYRIFKQLLIQIN